MYYIWIVIRALFWADYKQFKQVKIAAELHEYFVLWVCMSFYVYAKSGNVEWKFTKFLICGLLQIYFAEVMNNCEHHLSLVELFLKWNDQ